MTALYAIIILSNLLLGVSTVILSKHRIASYFFALATLCFSLWAFSIYQFFFAPEQLTFLSKLLSCQLAFFSGGAGVLSLSLLLVHYPKNLIQNKAVKIVSSATITLFLLSSFQGSFVKTVTESLEILYGPWRFLFGSYVISFLIFAIVLSIYNLKTMKNYMDRLRLKFLIYSFVLTIGTSFLFNFIGPLLGYGKSSAIGPICLTIFLGMNGYAILRHQLFDIEVIIKKSIQYLGLSFSVFFVFFLTLFSYGQLLSDHDGDIWMPIIVSASIFVFLYTPLKDALDRLTERLFFQGEHDYGDLLKQFSIESKKCHNLDQFSSHLIQMIKKTIKVKEAFLYLRRDDGRYLLERETTVGEDKEEEIPKLVLESLAKKEGLIFLEELRTKSNTAIISEWRENGLELVLSLSRGEKRRAYILIGEKLSESGFQKEEISFLKTLKNYANTAIENLLFYEKVEKRIARAQKLNRFFVETSGDFNQEKIVKKIMSHIQDLSQKKMALFFLTLSTKAQFYSEKEQLSESKSRRAEAFLEKFLEAYDHRETGSSRCLSEKDSLFLWHFLELPMEEKNSSDLLFLPFYLGEDLIAGTFVIVNSTRKELEVSSELLKAFSQQIAMIIKNLDLYQLNKTMNDSHEDLLDNMMSGVIFFDKNLKIRHINKRALSYLNLSHDAAIQESVETLSSQYPKFTQVQESFEHRTPLTDEFEMTVEGNQKIDLAINTGYIDCFGDRGVVAILSDVTTMKALESRSQQLNRLSALGRLASGISEEMSGPLQLIKDLATKIPNEWEAPEFRRNYERLVVPEVEKINSICRALLDLGKSQKPKLEALDISGLLSEAKVLLTGEIQSKEIDLRISNTATTTLIGDKRQLIHLLLNLGTNAIQALGDTGGTVEIEIQDGEKQSVEILVRDSGKGIDSEDIKTVFKPFFTTKDNQLGLGLTVAERIALSHNAKIKLRSKDIGTEVTVDIPSLKKKETR